MEIVYLQTGTSVTFDVIDQIASIPFWDHVIRSDSSISGNVFYDKFGGRFYFSNNASSGYQPGYYGYTNIVKFNGVASEGFSLYNGPVPPQILYNDHTMVMLGSSGSASAYNTAKRIYVYTTGQNKDGDDAGIIMSCQIAGEFDSATSVYDSYGANNTYIRCFDSETKNINMYKYTPYCVSQTWHGQQDFVAEPLTGIKTITNNVLWIKSSTLERNSISRIQFNDHYYQMIGNILVLDD